MRVDLATGLKQPTTTTTTAAAATAHLPAGLEQPSQRARVLAHEAVGRLLALVLLAEQLLHLTARVLPSLRR